MHGNPFVRAILAPTQPPFVKTNAADWEHLAKTPANNGLDDSTHARGTAVAKWVFIVATRAQTDEFKLQQSIVGEARILSLSGYMGNAEFREAARVLEQLLELKQRRVVLDLTALSFTTSVSLARFLVCGREFQRHGGQLKIAGLSPWLTRLARMAGFARKDFEPDLATAVRRLAQGIKTRPSLAKRRK